ncbi:hypothetical protein BT69DRAFT_1235465 [Atractiella rhizophila]|nr:hypothetical protein BT69DRAFT_1235465 [Atractiella rhizophila]
MFLLLLLFLQIHRTLGHAAITSPPIRQPGAALTSICGSSSTRAITSDATGHIEEQLPILSSCPLTLCRGMQFDDQPAENVQVVKPGDEMTMRVDCTIPHGGPANVSLVDVNGAKSKEGEVIGDFLKTFDDFCPTDGETPADQSKLTFKLPSAKVIGDSCSQAGDCVVQLFWATPDFSQNYYYCVDVQFDKEVASATTVTEASDETPTVNSSVPEETSEPSDETPSGDSSTPIVSRSSTTSVGSGAVPSSVSGTLSQSQSSEEEDVDSSAPSLNLGMQMAVRTSISFVALAWLLAP